MKHKLNPHAKIHVDLNQQLIQLTPEELIAVNLELENPTVRKIVGVTRTIVIEGVGEFQPRRSYETSEFIFNLLRRHAKYAVFNLTPLVSFEPFRKGIQQLIREINQGQTT
jgi:hypothetical protein